MQLRRGNQTLSINWGQSIIWGQSEIHVTLTPNYYSDPNLYQFPAGFGNCLLYLLRGGTAGMVTGVNGTFE